MAAAVDISASRPREHEVREWPRDTDAEASILGGVILQNSVLARLESLETDHFYDLRHKVVWQAIRNLAATDTPIDPITLEAEVEKQGKLDAIGGVAFIGLLVQRVPTPDNVVHYARLVRDKHLARELALRAHGLFERSLKTGQGYEPDELLAEAETTFAEIGRKYRDDAETIPFISVPRALEDLEVIARSPIYKTPFQDLNEALGFGGMLGGQIYYLSAGTGIGKTTWVGAVANHYATECDGDVLVATWEMMPGYFVARIAADKLQTHSNEIIRHPERHRFEAVQKVSNRIVFLEKPSLDMLRRGARWMTEKAKKPPLVIIDYIQLLSEVLLTTMQKPDPRQATTLASATMRNIARECGCSVLIVSAAGRLGTRKLAQDVRRLPPHELVDVSKESGAIEYDGAGVIVLSLSEEMDGDEQVATMTVAKSRFGTKIHVDARYNGKYGTWREIGRVPYGKPPAKDKKVEEPKDTSKLREKILKAIAKTPPCKTKKDVLDRTGGRKADVNAEIGALLDAGMIRESSIGFQVGGEPPPPAVQTELPEAQS